MLDKTLKLSKDIWSGLLDLVYPPFCLVCEKDGNEHLCAECIEKIDVIEPPYCRKCGMPVENTYYCRDCREREYYFESACSAGIYEGVLQKAIHLFKYRNNPVLAQPLADLMIRVFPTTHLPGKIDFAIPVPIHHSRYIERGFNQSEELAKIFCKRYSIPLETALLQKHRKTHHQANLPQDERLSNVQGSFRVSKPEIVANRRILLIDDVFTTGGTLNEAAKTLKNAGASSVYAYTLARSL